MRAAANFSLSRLDYIARFVSESNVDTINVREMPGYRLELRLFDSNDHVRRHG
jgi:hypothetical protein